MISRLAGALALALALTLSRPAQAQSNRLVVSPQGPYFTIQAALLDAPEGSVIEVRPGVYAAPLVVEKSVTLDGAPANGQWPVIDGGGQGTVVELNAPDIVFRGFEVRGSGDEPDRNHAGIAVTAPRVVVENNRLHEVLFGIFVAQADDSVLRGNDITGKAKYDIARKGDGIRLWYSQRVTVEGNHVYDVRDVVMWYSNDVALRDNVIERARYGVHLMYCDGARIERNHLEHNSVGIYTMYTDRVVMRENLIRGQRGPSGYALGFKDADEIEVVNNLLVDNRAGMFLDGTPFRPGGYARFRGNILAFNDVGVIVQPAVQGATIEDNTFWENVEQVAVQGGGLLGENSWAGNYWSEYAGFDADGDGQSDAPYRAERFFENLTDREPRLRALLYSPAAQAIEFAAAAFPLVRPQPKFTDPSPRLEPLALPPFASSPDSGSADIAPLAVALLGLGAGCGVLARARSDGNVRTRQLGLFRVWWEKALTQSRRAAKVQGNPAFSLRLCAFALKNPADPVEPQLAMPGIGEGASRMPVRVETVSKRFGKVQALQDVSFEVGAGEAVALWGANGAGKTTLLKAMIGLIDFEGDILIAGHDVRRAGKIARRSIGYVPQETVFYDWGVQATMEFYARLKKVDPGRIASLLDRLGLAEHARKQVSALSGGLKQRLALAIALLADPPVLLLDEPTANLDARARADYLALLTGLRREGRTVIFASHRFEEIDALADRVLLLEQGRLVESLDSDTLRSRHTPDVQMTLWMPEEQCAAALACLAMQGLAAHLNGKGTVVVQVSSDQKMKPFRLLSEQHITVTDFEVEWSRAWN